MAVASWSTPTLTKTSYKTPNTLSNPRHEAPAERATSSPVPAPTTPTQAPTPTQNTGGRESTLGGYTGATPAGFTGSTTATAPVSVDAQTIINQMNANSSAWHTEANSAARAALEDENKSLAQQLKAMVENGANGSSTSYAPTYNAELGTWQIAASSTPGSPALHPEVPEANIGQVNHVDPSGLQNMLGQIVASQTQQSNSAIDNATQLSITELERAMQDAAGQYQTQRNQVSADEQQALDNQALNSQLKGDKGGIGNAQYAAIQNNAAQNRLAVNQAQTKLSTDTARQISDLRAQGEFEKADKLLSITQSYLSQLMSLEQWAMETNLGVDEFNAQLQQWEAEYALNVQQFKTDTELSVAQLTGQFSDGTSTLEARNLLNERLASSGEALLGMGIMPSDEQLAALGFTKEQAQAYITAAQLAAAAKASGGSGGGGGDDSSGGLNEQMKAAGVTDYDGARAWLAENAPKIDAGEREDIANYYPTWLDGQAGKTTDQRQSWYGGLGANARQLVSNIQRNNARNGVSGLSQSQINSINAAANNGKITDAEVDLMLNLLGV